MAKRTEKCSKNTVTYDDRCDWTCQCHDLHSKCDWTVSCPDGKGGYYDTTGSDYLTATGEEDTPPRHPSVHVVGELAGIAHSLTNLWKRSVTVPDRLAHQRVDRSLSGTLEEIAQALGLKLS